MGQLIEAFQRGGTLMEGLLISRGIFVFFVCFCLPHSCRGCVSTSTWPNLWEPESEPVTTTEPESEPVTTTEPESEPSQTGKKLENDEMYGIPPAFLLRTAAQAARDFSTRTTTVAT